MSESKKGPQSKRGWTRVPELSAAVGTLFWIAGDILFLPHVAEKGWGDGLLLLAALVIVPLALRLAAVRGADGKHPKSWVRAVVLQPPAAVALALSYTLPTGWQAAGWSIPWFLLTLQVALFGLARARHTGFLPMHELSVNAGLVFLAAGGAWTLLSRFGATPLGFDHVLVLLTAIHFHYAGLALPLLTGLAVRTAPSFLGRVAIVGVLASVPLVAAGITVAQLGGGRLLEAVGAVVASIAAWIVAALHIRLALSGAGPSWARRLWWVSAVSLAVSMALAAAYGLREYVPTDWLDIPTMRALHGTAQGIGFGALGTLSWWLHESRRSTDDET